MADLTRIQRPVQLDEYRRGFIGRKIGILPEDKDPAMPEIPPQQRTPPVRGVMQNRPDVPVYQEGQRKAAIGVGQEPSIASSVAPEFMADLARQTPVPAAPTPLASQAAATTAPQLTQAAAPVAAGLAAKATPLGQQPRDVQAGNEIYAWTDQGGSPESSALNIVGGRVGPPAVAGFGLGGGQETREPVRDYNAEIDSLVDKLMSDPGNLAKMPASGGGWKYVGGLKKNVLNQITELRKAQLGLQGQELSARESAAARKQAAELGFMSNQAQLEGTREDRAARLAETKRYHDIIDLQGKERREAEKAVRDEANAIRRTQGVQKMIETYGEFTDVMGQKRTSPLLSIFTLMDSGMDISTLPEEYWSIGERVRAGMRAVNEEMTAANKGVKPTAAEVKREYYKRITGG